MRNFVLNFMLRVVMGILGICLCNALFSDFGVKLHLGLNPLNLLTVGTLGFSGFGVLLAISLFTLL